MGYSTISLDIDAGLARLTLNQPEAGNPFNAAFCQEMCDAATELSARDDVRAVLLTGRGKFFSVGGDIRAFTEDRAALPGNILNWTATLHTALARLYKIDAPLVAGLHATCMGGALAMVAGCDLVYCARSAKLGSAYAQIGYSCDATSSVTLSQRLGVARARRFLLLAEVVSAEEAGKMGLVDFVCDDATVLEEAETAARKLAAGPTRAYGEIRRLLANVSSRPLESQIEAEAQALAGIAKSADAWEGLTAFAEKRKPRFEGR